MTGEADPTMWDLIVVGGGMAGWTAARRAQELGARVLVLEKTDSAAGRGNGRISGGVVHPAYLNPTRPPEVLRQQITDITDGHCRPELAHALAYHCGRAVGWLRTQGAEIVKDGEQEYRNAVLAPLRPPAPGMVWEDAGPDRFLRLISELFLARGGICRTGVRARELVRQGGAVTGVVVESAAGTETVSARAVLLADGGFQANPELLERYAGLKPGEVKLRAAATGTGDGLLMGLAAGAATANMEFFYGHCLHREALTCELLWPYPWADDLVAGGMVVGPDGRRIGNEGFGGVGMANIIARSAAPLGNWAIFDQAVWEGPGRQNRVPSNPLFFELGARVVTADSVPELATRAGLPAGALLETVEQYNRSLREGGRLDPERTGSPYRLEQAPFHAVPVVAGITFTSGGLLVNANAQVLDQDEQPIPGLYAAGSTAGGLQGGPRGGYVGGLAEAFTFGVLAGEHVAATVAG